MLISTLRHMRLVGSVLLVIAAALSVANTAMAQSADDLRA